jgi:transmembrane 9 superfamily protein 2/4
MPDNPVEVQYEPGYRLGYEKDRKVYFNNHLKFVMKYHLDPAGTYRVVGFLIETQSINRAGLEITGAGLHCPAPHCPALHPQGTRAR